MSSDQMVTPFLFLLVCFAALVHAQDQSGFISIDCGIEDQSTYVDATTGITYVSDAQYLNTSNGVSKSILTDQNGLDRQLINLKSFPLGGKNCYTLNPTNLNGRSRYFVRARFLYGNYDNKNESPEFDLYLGAGYWFTYHKNITLPFEKEILYAPKHVSASSFLCLVNLGRGTPFISALEIRPVDDAIYLAGADSLDVLTRFYTRASANSSQQRTRYKDDPFDRVWRESNLSRSYKDITTNSNIQPNMYKVPVKLMQTAVKLQDDIDADPIRITYIARDGVSIGHYFYMHFAEINPSDSGLIREFTVTINGKLISVVNLQTPFQTLTVATGQIEEAARFNVTLTRTTSDGLPPILNLVEFYRARPFTHQLTENNEYLALVQIQMAYNLKRDWQGDACLPVAWDGITCSNNSLDDPRITSLNLSSSGLTGSIPPSISKLPMLETLDLSNNALTGEVPDFLGELEKLKDLVLSTNKLTGKLPDKLIQKRKKGSLKLSFEGNPELCKSGECEDQSSSSNNNGNNNNKTIIISICVGVPVGLGLIGVVVNHYVDGDCDCDCDRERRKKRKQRKAAAKSKSDKTLSPGTIEEGQDSKKEPSGTHGKDPESHAHDPGAQKVKPKSRIARAWRFMWGIVSEEA